MEKNLGETGPWLIMSELYCLPHQWICMGEVAATWPQKPQRAVQAPNLETRHSFWLKFNPYDM